MSNDGLHEYQIGKTLGQGSTATVKLVMHVLTNEKYAMKIFNSQKTNRSIRPEPNFSNNHDINVNKLDYYDTCRTPETTPLFKLEIQLLLRLHHPNIIKVYQIIKRRTDCIYIMDFACNGMLLNKLNTRAYIPEPEARKYFRQLVSAIDHCHLSTIVHRDIKLENLLLDANDNLLVSDFGLATIADKDSQEKNICGTQAYAALEILMGKLHCAYKIDIWAMGVVLYKLLTGSCPFTTSNATIMIRNMKNQTINQPNHLSASVKDLFKKIFTIESKRIDMAGLRKHEWTNLEYTGPPDRVYPISNPTCTLNDRVQSIKHTDNTTIYTLYPFFKHYEATCTTTPISVTANKQNSVTQVVENQSKHTNEAQPTEWRSSWVLGSKDWHFLNQPPSQFRAATVGLKLINGNMFDPPTMLQDILSALQTLCSKYELQVKRIPAYYLFLVQVDQQFTIELEIVRLKLKKYGLEIRSKENSSSRFIKDLSDCINWS